MTTFKKQRSKIPSSLKSKKKLTVKTRLLKSRNPILSLSQTRTACSPRLPSATLSSLTCTGVSRTQPVCTTITSEQKMSSPKPREKPRNKCPTETSLKLFFKEFPLTFLCVRTNPKSVSHQRRVSDMTLQIIQISKCRLSPVEGKVGLHTLSACTRHLKSGVTRVPKLICFRHFTSVNPILDLKDEKKRQNFQLYLIKPYIFLN